MKFSFNGKDGKTTATTTTIPTNTTKSFDIILRPEDGAIALFLCMPMSFQKNSSLLRHILLWNQSVTKSHSVPLNILDGNIGVQDGRWQLCHSHVKESRSEYMLYLIKVNKDNLPDWFDVYIGALYYVLQAHNIFCASCIQYPVNQT